MSVSMGLALYFLSDGLTEIGRWRGHAAVASTVASSSAASTPSAVAPAAAQPGTTTASRERFSAGPLLVAVCFWGGAGDARASVWSWDLQRDPKAKLCTAVCSHLSPSAPPGLPSFLLYVLVCFYLVLLLSRASGGDAGPDDHPQPHASGVHDQQARHRDHAQQLPRVWSVHGFRKRGHGFVPRRHGQRG